ncbi:MAG: carboxypeptidase regulatory-like domain-containing protein, partial [Vicinamibacterales bacterium]
PLPARVMPDKTNGVVFGEVHLADDRSAWFYDELFGENRTSFVRLLDAGRKDTLGGPVRVNASGQFALAGAPRGVGVTVQAQAESASAMRSVAATGVSFGGAVVATRIQLPNKRPEILTVVARNGAQALKTAAAGSTVRLEAITRDADSDALTYAWRVVAGNGVVSGGTGSSTDWKLPTEAGAYSAYVLAKDGRGGFASKRFDFVTGKVAETFSGRAVDSASAPVSGATVTANGTPTTTNANGFFIVNTPLATRYVLNIRKPGFALFSRVVDAGSTGQTWRLVRAQQQTVDPTQPIVLVDKRPELEKRKAKGVTIRVPAKALVDAAGKPAAGPLTAYLATFDIGGGEAPGDWGAMQDSVETNLISYGAGFVEFVDAAGATYNLAPGSQAEIELYPPATMLAAAPAGAPMWAYDEKDGYWKVSGSGQFEKATGKFVGRVEHFSAFNTDIAFEDAACLKVLLYPPLPVGARLRISDPSGVHFTQTFEFVLDRPLRGIYRLPANVDVKLELQDPAGNAYGNLVLEEEGGVELPGDIVNTGNPIPDGETLWPEEPYKTCKLVILRLDEASDPSIFLTFKGEGSAVKAEKYYDAVDPDDLRETLGEWWSTNGFTLGADGWPDNAERTSYLNDNDLGSGRDMYFRELGGGHLAAFVTNYGLFDQNHANADLAEARLVPGATVCMEYSPVENQPAGSPAIVKFFVYAGNGGKVNAARAGSANLDTFGEKFVPNLCLNCHGGSYYISDAGTPGFSDINMGARFRELDTATYKFPGGDLTPSAAAADAFMAQNLMIRNAGSGCTAPAIRDLLDGWYADGASDQDAWIPAGWAGAPEDALYRDVVATSCRTCHVAFANDDAEFGNTWTTYEQFQRVHDTIKDYVLCGSDAPADYRYMPHAAVTYRNFWLSGAPHRPGVLRNYSDGATWAKLGECD